jgi:hypothetical protein
VRRKQQPSIIRPGRAADTSCAACGRPLTLWDATTALDGRTVCAKNCLGAGIVRARGMPQYQGDDAPPPVPVRLDTGAVVWVEDPSPGWLPPGERGRCGRWSEDDYGGAFDGRDVSSDADPGL